MSPTEGLLRNTRTAALECRLMAISERAAAGHSRVGDAEIAALAESILAKRSAPRRVKPARPKLAVRICIPWRPLIDEICLRHRLTFDEMITDCRSRRIVNCRQEIWWSLNKIRGVALAEIGRRFGGFDHTSIRHGVLVHAARAAAN